MSQPSAPEPPNSNHLYLDAVYPAVIADSAIVVRDGDGWELYENVAAEEVSLSDFTLSAKVTKLTLDRPLNIDFLLRNSTIYAQSEVLRLAAVPDEDPVVVTTGEMLALNDLTDGLEKGQTLILSGEPADAPGTTTCEVLSIDEVVHDLHQPSHTNVRVSHVGEAQASAYVRNSVLINANVVRATHGESVSEMLGSGDGRQAYQRFALKQPPLTHVHTASASGAESTLQVRVNDVLWHEAPTLYARAPLERIYTTHTDDDGTTTILFGDGVTGTRLPSGQGNVRADYRKGIGLAGNLKANQLTTLLDRPLGVKGVTNPLPATGGDDPETLGDARRNAPLTVRTIDRAVSLIDYEDFARSFAGVAKACAIAGTRAAAHAVFITVAGPQGALIPDGGPVQVNLLGALRDCGDPHVQLTLSSYRPRTFLLAAKVKIDPDFEAEIVRAEIEATLRAAFSFEARALGQPVTRSEVVTAIHSIAGVVGVDIDALQRSSAPPRRRLSIQSRILADRARVDDTGTFVAAELLTLDPGPLNLVVKSEGIL